jgi:hypothetical protein
MNAVSTRLPAADIQQVQKYKHLLAIRRRFQENALGDNEAVLSRYAECCLR